MAASDKPKWSHKELRARVDRLRKAEKELEALDAPRDVFATEIESIRGKLKSIPQVEEVEAELKALRQKVAEYQASLKEAATVEEKARKALESAGTAVGRARSAGLDVAEAEDLLRQAREAYERKDYQLAANLASRAGELAARAERSAKPQVVVELDVEDYRPGEWKSVELGVINQGKAPAQSVELKFSPEVEVKWLPPVDSLEAGGRKMLNIGLKPKDAGDIPLDVEVRYRDMAGKDYSGVQRFWLKVRSGVAVQQTLAEAQLGVWPLPQLDNYTLERKIGSGGFADVYLGRDLEGLAVAVKIPRMSQYETIEAKDFLGEAELWSKLTKQDVPNIVRLYEYGTVPCPWIAMEYMSGGSLRDRIQGLACKECLAIVLKLMEAVGTAHQYGVIHRDIKPENVLFDNANAPRLTDWGLGRVLLDASMSSVGFKGTLAYSAPEQLATSRFGSVGWWTDIYQMGVLLYEMLTGMLPFAGSEPGTVIPRVLSDPPPRPSRVSSQVPEVLDELALQAMAKRKENRFKSMYVFADRLEQVMKGM